MEKYLQELDKINELLVFTDKRPFQLWNFFANNFSFIFFAILITGIFIIHQQLKWSPISLSLSALSNN